MKAAFIIFFVFVVASIAYAQPICDFNGRDSLRITFMGDTVNILDSAACGNCGSQFAITITRSADTVYILETDTTSRLMLCDCVFNLSATVVGLDTGSYWAVIYRTFPWESGSSGPMFVGAMPFTYRSAAVGSFSFKGTQSSCLSTGPQGVQDQRHSVLPKEYNLAQAYPNPFNPATTIRYQLPTGSEVSLKVYDLLGQVIATLEDLVEQPGIKQAVWDASSFASGIYFYRLEATSLADPTKTFTSVKKCLLVK